jgi:DNA invertase Pin-like site-specific DNA recombinase
MSFKPISDDLRKRILTRIKDGATTPEIVEETGVSSSTIRRIAKSAGLQRRSGAPPIMEGQIRKCLDLHDSGFSISEISYKTGLMGSTITVYLRRGAKKST